MKLVEACAAFWASVAANKKFQRLVMWIGIVDGPVRAVQYFEKEITILEEAAKRQQADFDQMLKVGNFQRERLARQDELLQKNELLLQEKTRQLKAMEDAWRDVNGELNEIRGKWNKNIQERHDLKAEIRDKESELNQLWVRCEDLEEELQRVRNDTTLLNKISELEGVIRYYEGLSSLRKQHVEQECGVPTEAPEGGFIPRNMPLI